MKTALIAVGVLVGLFVMLGLWFMGVYNGLVTKQEAVNSAWAQVQTQYQRRLDLVPNLVETVKGAANFEKSTLTAVVEARSKVGSFTVDKSVLNDPAQFKRFADAQGELGRALSHLMAVVENYPNIKATENFRSLQDQLEGTENRIAVARRDFNEAVQGYNVGIRRFPASVIAGVAGFKEKAYFAAEETAQTAPAVKF
ncbi:MAG: LemA family protein [Elusimicrobia bacterium]|nr:LemA family protein [Elusimicrobiota bacterium]